MNAKPRTLFDKIWESRVISERQDGLYLVHVDRHFLIEVTSPQAFEGLRLANRAVFRPAQTLAVIDHNISTKLGEIVAADSELQMNTLRENCARTGIELLDTGDKRNGIAHVIGPEQGLSLPGTVIACGDSHTATHGAFGSLALGVGTSEVEHILATQAILRPRAKSMRVYVSGQLPRGCTAKDLILAVIGKIGTAGGTGHVIEYAGPAIENLSMEGRLSVCNMSIEAGAQAGLIAPDEVTFQHIKGRPRAPKGDAWNRAVAHWRTLPSDPGATYDIEVMFDVSEIEPQVTWGTSPEDVAPISGFVPNPKTAKTQEGRDSMQRSLDYMGLTAGTRLQDIKVDTVFIGSCTNGRIEDLRAAAEVAKGRKVAPGVRALVVPGSGLVREMADAEGLGDIFVEAGFEWRTPGCSMCVALNSDRLSPGERCISTSNRNFEGRQGRGGRTHLSSPAMAAAAAVTGRLTDVRALLDQK